MVTIAHRIAIVWLQTQNRVVMLMVRARVRKDGMAPRAQTTLMNVPQSRVQRIRHASTLMVLTIVNVLQDIY
jgi:hypothetical protein